jgi:hypothetical protein
MPLESLAFSLAVVEAATVGLWSSLQAEVHESQSEDDYKAYNHDGFLRLGRSFST